MVTDDQKKRYNELSQRYKELRKQSNKRKGRYRWISFSIGAVLGMIVAVTSIFFEEMGTLNEEQYPYFLYWELILMFIFYIPHIILHEAGHLVFGLLSGYEFLSFRIFSIIFYKKDGKLHRSKYSVKGTGGQCLMRPPKKRADGSFPFVLYNLGGGLMNMAASLPFLIPAIVTKNPHTGMVCVSLVLSGILTAATNLIPMNMVIQNDGMNVKTALRDKNLQEAFYLQLLINAQMSDGKRLTEFPPELFELPYGTDETNTLATYLQFCSYTQKLGKHDLESAGQLLRIMEKNLPWQLPAIFHAINMERLYLMVLQKAPLEEIAVLYRPVRLGLASAKTNVDIQRIRYAYETLLTEEEKQDIMILIMKRKPKKWKECDQKQLYLDFRKAAEAYPIQGLAVVYADMVEEIRQVSSTATARSGAPSE